MSSFRTRVLSRMRLPEVVISSVAILVLAALAEASPHDRGAMLGWDQLTGTTDALTTTPVPAPMGPSAEDQGEIANPITSEISPTPSDEVRKDDNHGTHVSRVARCVPPGPDHGEAVREIARTHENEAAKADEICARYDANSVANGDTSAGEEAGEGKERDKAHGVHRESRKDKDAREGGKMPKASTSRARQ